MVLGSPSPAPGLPVSPYSHRAQRLPHPHVAPGGWGGGVLAAQVHSPWGAGPAASAVGGNAPSSLSSQTMSRLEASGTVFMNI